ncbi:MAG: DUF6273 domain-containing protein [Bacilli bacterium]|nr:DUF6273 domain-containing protein [Bacilli bacterium]
MKKLGLLVMPLMAISLLASCGGGNNPGPVVNTYTITFDCQQCKAFDKDDKEVTSVTVPVVESEHTIYQKFHFEGKEPFKVPLKSSITIKKTDTKEIVDYEYANGNLFVPIVGDLTISAKGTSYDKSLENSSWDEIAEISATGRANEFFRVSDTKKVQLQYQSGNIYQTVRIIDFNKDKDPNGNNLGITFEFADLISDANGYSLASLWQNTSTTEGSNYNYIDSTIRKNLTGKGRGSIMWYEKGSGTVSKEYTTSVYDMLPDDLTEEGILKTTRKKVNLHTTGDWVETDVDDKLFLLSVSEMKYQTDYAEVGEPYEYYKNADTEKADPIRIKQQVKGSADALIDVTPITESAYGSGSSYAGYNSSAVGEGGRSWLRSPTIRYRDAAWMCKSDGDLANVYVYRCASATAPAFCI